MSCVDLSRRFVHATAKGWKIVHMQTCGWEMVTSVTLALSYPSRELKELFSEQLLLQYPIISPLSERHTDGVAGEEDQENDSRSK